MELHIVIEGDKDLSGQLYRQLAEAIRSGRLGDGQQIPPSRLLATQLGVSRKTVSEAYARLTYDKLLVGRIGKGSFVRAGASAPARQLAGHELASAELLAKWDAIATPFRIPRTEDRPRYDFIGGAAAPGHFPTEAWRRCVLHALRQDAERGRYAPTAGVPELRAAIARHAAFARGVVCTGERVVVTSGAQQALDLLGRVLLAPGSIVAVEDPGYPPVRALYASQGARVVGVPVDDEGIVVDQIPDGTRLIYVTPAHQLPLGMPMSPARRVALLERARQLGAIVIEDDYDSEFRYEGRPTDSLQSMDRHGLVVFVGTFSKILLPELRLGYMVLPPAIENAVLTAKHLSDWHTGTMMQYALAKFIDDGYLLKHIRRSHAVYASRRAKLQQLIGTELAPWFRLVPSTAGFHMTARCTELINLAALIKLARRADIGLYSIEGFYHSAPPLPGLLFGYGSINTIDIEPALKNVRNLLSDCS